MDLYLVNDLGGYGKKEACNQGRLSVFLFARDELHVFIPHSNKAFKKGPSPEAALRCKEGKESYRED